MALGTNIKFPLYIIYRLVFITQVESVYSAVRTESLYNIEKVWSLEGYLLIACNHKQKMFS